jgi:hypothetical protein
MAGLNFYPTTVNDESFVRGPARIMYANITIGFPTLIGNVVNLSTYAAMANWNDLGATRSGVQISVNNTEESFDIDQILGDIDTLPTSWEASVSTQLAEMTLDRLSFAWENITVLTVSQGSGPEKNMTFGTPLSYTKRRLAVGFVRPSGKIRLFVFRKVQRAPQESTITYAKTGEQQTVPVRWKALPDLSVIDPYQRFFSVFDQV